MRPATWLTITTCLAFATAAAAHGQTAPAATGTVLWVRTGGRSAADLASGLAGGPQFHIGIRRNRFTLGLGVGLTTVRTTDAFDDPNGQLQSEEISTLTAFQVGPTLLWETRRTADGRVRATVVAGVSVGRVSSTDDDRFRDFNGQFVTTTQKTTGTLFGATLGLGGDYFLHPRFAIGLEAGLQGTFASNVEEEGGGDRFGASANGIYSGLRATLVF